MTMSLRVWAVRAGGGGAADPLFIENGQIAVSFPDAQEDLSALPAQRTAFKDIIARNDGGTRPGAIPIQAGQLFRFVHEMRIGDRVIYPRKTDRSLMWGEVATPYLYDRSGAASFPHRRGVRWLASMSRDQFSQGALYELSSVLTLFEIRNFAAELLRRLEPSNDVAGISAGDDDSEIRVAHDISETTRDFIAKKLKSELKGFPLEPFVADLFRAMGYNAQTTRAVRDDGVDVIAHRDELGIEPPILKIQIKAYDGNVGPEWVKAFYAMIHERDVGIFVTTGGYTAAARAFAAARGNLKLIDGIEFVSLIEKYYDSLDLKFRKQIPLRRVLAPDILAENP